MIARSQKGGLQVADILIDLVENKIILEIQDGNHGELHPKSIDFVNQGIPFLTADCMMENEIDYEKCKLLPSKFLKTLRNGF